MVLQEEQCYQNNIYYIPFLATGIILFLFLIRSYLSGDQVWLSLILADNTTPFVIPMVIWHVKSLDRFKLPLLLLEFMTSDENCHHKGVLKYCLMVGLQSTNKRYFSATKYPYSLLFYLSVSPP